MSAVSSPPSGGESKPSEQTPLNNAFGDLDKLFGDTGQSQPEPTKTEERPRTAPPPVEKPEAKKETPPPPPKPETKQEVKPSTEPKTTPELRKAYDAQKKRVSQMEAELKSIKEERQKQTNVSDHPEFKSLKERFEAAEKKANELAEKIRFSAFEQSEEYHNQYVKPFEEAYRVGMAKTASLRTLPKINPDSGEVTEPARQATQNDFVALLQMDDEAAATTAEALFGPSKASLILWHRENVLKANSAREGALENYRKTSGERSKADSERLAQDTKAKQEAWEKNNKMAKEKYPQFFAEAEGDDEGNNLLRAGYSRFESAFNGGKTIDKDGNPSQLTPAQLTALHSEMFNKAAAFNRIAHQNKSLSARVKELESELEAFKNSEPGQGEGRKVEGEEKSESWEDALNKLAVPIM